MLSLCLQSTRGSYCLLPVIPASSSLRGKGSLEGSSLGCMLIADGFPITILFASSLLCLVMLPFCGQWGHGLSVLSGFTRAVGLRGFCVVLFSLSCKKAVIFLYLAASLRETRQSERGWCVSDRSLGDAAGKLLIWLVWSWKLTRSHWKWLPLGISFILVYLFSLPFPEVFPLRRGFCCCSSCSLWLVGWILTFHYTYLLLCLLLFGVVFGGQGREREASCLWAWHLCQGLTRYKMTILSRHQVFLKIWSVYYLATCCSKVLAFVSRMKTEGPGGDSVTFFSPYLQHVLN